MPSKTTRSAAASSASPAAPASTKNTRSRPVAKFRMRVTAGDVIAIGPGKIALLEAIGAMLPKDAVVDKYLTEAVARHDHKAFQDAKVLQFKVRVGQQKQQKKK